jgi:hypothetical protein
VTKKIVSNVVVGKAEVSPSAPTHVKGIREGNEVGSLRRERGIHPVNAHAVATAERSTGINAGKRNSITPGSPNLGPA